MEESYCLEVGIIQLKLPSLSDFSKVKCVLTVNTYTQSIPYPFKTMLIPKVDDFSVLEISITHSNQLIAGLDIPLALFKNKKSQTFKLTDFLAPSERKKNSPVKPKSEQSEITLCIKYILEDPTVASFKLQIKGLEQKIRDSAEMVDEGLKSRRELQTNFEEATKTLSKMIQSQDDTIKYLISEKEKMNEYLKSVESDLNLEKKKYIEALTRCEELENSMDICRTPDYRKDLHRPVSSRSRSIDDPTNSARTQTPVKKSPAKTTTKKLQNTPECIKKSTDRTEKENSKLKSEISELQEKNYEYQEKIKELEKKLKNSESRASEENFSRGQSSESLVLSLRREIARLTAKNKTMANKMNGSKNNLIQENERLMQKIYELEEKNVEIEKELEKYQLELAKLKENQIEKDRPAVQRQNSYKLIGKYVENVKKVEMALNKSPRPYKAEENFNINLFSEELKNADPQETERRKKYQSFQKNFLEKKIETDALDDALKDFIAAYKDKLEINFIKEKEGVYLFGSKRVFIKLEKGKLFVRIGGGFMSIEEFVSTYTALEQEKTDRSQSRGKATPRSPFQKITNSNDDISKSTACFGAHRRSASVCKYPKKTEI